MLLVSPKIPLVLYFTHPTTVAHYTGKVASKLNLAPKKDNMWESCACLQEGELSAASTHCGIVERTPSNTAHLILFAAREANLPSVCPLASMMYHGFLELSAWAALG